MNAFNILKFKTADALHVGDYCIDRNPTPRIKTVSFKFPVLF